MRATLFLSALVLCVPVVMADPDPASSIEWLTYYGIITQGERDDWWEWWDMWMGEDQWACTNSTNEDVVLLTILDGSENDILTLETYSLAGPLHSLSTSDAPAAMYGFSSGCMEFAVDGTHVATSVRYRVEFYDQWRLACEAGLTC